MIASVDIAGSIQTGLNAFFGFVPNLIGFLVILIVGYIIARIVRTVLSKLLEKLGLDRALHSGTTGQYVERFSPGASPTRLIAGVAFWFIILGALSVAISALKIQALTNFMGAIYGYLPNVIAALLIFVLAGVVAAAVSGLVAKVMGDTPTGKVVASVVPALVIGIAVFMILNQLKIAPQIVQITYVALIGSLALGGALAFGLGGRDVASRLLEDAYQRGRDNKDQIKGDLETGKDRALERKDQAEAKIREERRRTEGDAGPGAGATRVRPGAIGDAAAGH